jgi:DNA polymerase III subunit alpha
MSIRPYVPLHLHTEYSLLDGATRIKDLVAKAQKENMPAVAITDHGVLYGAVELSKACHGTPVKPIIGCEVYIIDGDITDKTTKQPLYHLTVLARNQQGYKNLVKLNSTAHLEGYYYKPRINREMLARYCEGLIVLSGCLGSQLNQMLLAGNYQAASEIAAWYRDCFQDNYYLEIQDHGLQEDRTVNRQLVRLSKELRIKLAATNDSHFTERGHACAHDALLCIQMAKYVSDPNRMKFTGLEYVKNGNEMQSLFHDHLDSEHIEAAIAATLEIADKAEAITFHGTSRLPVFPVPPGHTPETYLNQLVFEGLKQRYGEVDPEFAARARLELEVIEDMNYASYFLVVWDFIAYAREHGIPVGPGRGSAAGSLVAYCLGITNIDPIKYNLLFERFLNPERKSMPDIDTDFCIERRDEVIRYVAEKYGHDKVAQIITFNRMTSKAVLRDVARVLEFPLSETTKLTKMVPVVRGKPTPLSEMLEENNEFKRAYAGNEEAKQVIDLALNLEGINRTFGVHAAGLVISDVPLTDLIPLQRNNDGAVISQFNMDDLADVGLLKMDFLGLRNLTMIDRAIKIIEQTRDEKIDIDKIPLDDERTYQTISNGDLAGIFQLETSGGMRQVARDMKPSNMEDLSALIALYRPGPLDTGMIDKFIACKHGREQISYLTPQLEPILKDTYGQIVYQEQVMQMAQQLAGYSMGQADLLRRAMGKKKPEEMETQRELFLGGCAKNSINTPIASRLFDMMVQFAEYCFNKSHSQAYAVLTYQTAYLKTLYPVEYMTALLSSVSGDQDKVQGYIAECQAMGIDVLPPDINVSGSDFTADGNAIRFGLAAVKNVGEAAVQHIVSVRSAGEPFNSIYDFLNRVDLRVINKRALDALIRSGACGSLRISRKQALESLDALVESATRRQQHLASGQMSLFGAIAGETATAGGGNGHGLNIGTDTAGISISLYSGQLQPDTGEYPETELQTMEHELLGFYVTSHPLKRVQNRLRLLTTHNLKEAKELADGTNVVVGGLAVGIEKKLTRQNKVLYIIQLEDLHGKVEVVVYEEVANRVGPEVLKVRSLLLIKGKVKAGDETVSILANGIRKMSDAALVNVYLEKEQSFADLNQLKDILNACSGDDPVLLHFPKNDKNQMILIGSQYWVNASKGDLQAVLTKKLDRGVKVQISRVGV